MDSSLRGDFHAASLIWTVSSPIIAMVGIIGNMTTILVFVRKQRASSTTLYLTWVAVADLAVMLLVYPRWWLIYVFAFDVRTWNIYACKVHIFIAYITGQFSNMTLAVVTIERVICVMQPYKAKLVCTRRSARMAVGILTACLLAINVHLLYGYSLVEHLNIDNNTASMTALNVSHDDVIVLKRDVNMSVNAFHEDVIELNRDVNMSHENSTTIMKKCDWTHNEHYKYFYQNIFSWLHFVVAVFVPQFVFVFGGAIIIWKMSLSQKFRRRINTPTTRPPGREPHVYGLYDSKSRQITITLLLVNLVFFICMTPVIVFLLFRYSWVTESGMTETQEVIWAVINQMFYINHAVNFILFSITGKKFRQDVKELYGCKNPPPEQRYEVEVSALSHMASMGSIYSPGFNTNPSGAPSSPSLKRKQ